MKLYSRLISVCAVLALAAALILGCTGCSGEASGTPEASSAASAAASASLPESEPLPEPEPEPEPEPAPELPDDWQDLQLILNGELFTIPFSVEQLQQQGYHFYDDAAAEEMIPANCWDQFGSDMNFRDGQGGEPNLAVLLSGTGKGGALAHITFLNPNEEEAPRKDCLVTLISIEAQKDENGQMNEGAQYAVFPGGITIESTKDDVLAAYGEPTERYESPDSPTDLLQYQVQVWENNVNYVTVEFQFDKEGILLFMKIGYAPMGINQLFYQYNAETEQLETVIGRC